jgi:undecaprenyl diphosphate synthase
VNKIEALNHIAIIPDGNRRWADMKGVPHLEGHQAGAERMHQVVDNLIQLGLKYLTVWGFSTDNWKRTDSEVQSLFSLLELWITRDTPWLRENSVRLRHIGRLHELPEDLFRTIAAAMYLTRNNTGMTLNLAFNYTGRAEIVDAINRLIANGIPYKKGMPDVTEESFSRYLYTDGMPDVDLVIRTADELRLSNFMLWQTAYSEYYFTPAFWPDFDKLELEKALASYRSRERRFGGG